MLGAMQPQVKQCQQLPEERGSHPGAAQDFSLDVQPQNHMIINTQSVVMCEGHRKGTQGLPEATTGASEVNE